MGIETNGSGKAEVGSWKKDADLRRFSQIFKVKNMGL
jgi:hypothetical protein